MRLLLLWACTGPAPQDSPADSEPRVQDSEPPVEQGLVVYEGQGVLGEGYLGTEAWVVEHEDDARVLCRIEYTLTSVAEAEGCSACDWAVEAQVSEASVAAEQDPGCAGLDMDAAGLQGSRVYRGYQHEYLGHGDVLMVPDEEGTWLAVSFADFDEESGVFDYRWEDGFRPL